MELYQVAFVVNNQVQTVPIKAECYYIENETNLVLCDEQDEEKCRFREWLYVVKLSNEARESLLPPDDFTQERIKSIKGFFKKR